MIDLARLQAFNLLNALSSDGLTRAASQIKVRELPVGEVLFRFGERDRPIYFLLDGAIALQGSDGNQLLIQAGSEAASQPLSRLKPRRYHAVAASPVRVAAIDEDLLDQLLTADQSAAYEVSLIEGEDPAWMFKLFTSEAFGKVPADNLTALFGRMQPIEAKAGEVIIRQGEAGDYYYLIRLGRAKVERQSADGRLFPVAELGIGESCGEEALLSGDPRNATVSMIEDGQLMRLSQADFNSLLKPALVRRVTPREALALIRRGGRFLDVRTEAEFRERSLPGSLNLPLCNLRHLAANLPRDTPYVTVCQTGRRCTSAAFLLGQRGFDVYVLRDGLDAIDLDN